MPRCEIRDDYYNWLVEAVGAARITSNYSNLLQKLWRTPFRYTIRNDENRASYGQALRSEYFEERGQFLYSDLDFEDLWGDKISVLEVLWALAKQCFDQAEGVAPYNSIGWFWLFLENLGLKKYTDECWTEGCEDFTDAILDVFLDRGYTRKGVGGLFPLHGVKGTSFTADQRKTELWYQFMAYFAENW